jgi:lipopolysaccharide export system permease protein
MPDGPRKGGQHLWVGRPERHAGSGRHFDERRQLRRRLSIIVNDVQPLWRHTQPLTDRMRAVDAALVHRGGPRIYKVSAFHYDPLPVHTINRYILREISIPFGLGLAVFTLILLIARILKLVEMVVNRGVPFLEVLKLFSCILPAFLEVTVPMALLLGVLVAFGRLSSDSEIIALKTSGVSLYQLMRPVAVFALIIYVVALGLSLYARPWGNTLLRDGLYEIAKTRASAGIKEKVFTDDFSGLVIYVDHIEPPGNALHGILIADSRDPSQRNTVFAKVGVLVPNERQHVLTLRLLAGSIHAFYPKDQSYHRTDFSIYDITLDLNTALAQLRPREKDPSEMTVGELQAAIAAKHAAGQPAFSEAVELQRKFSIPFACLAFAAIGVPLGIRPSRSVHSRGFTLSLLLIFAYYLLLTLGESLGERGILPAGIALWLPNVLLAALALALFVSAARDRRITHGNVLRGWVDALRIRVKALARSGTA